MSTRCYIGKIMPDGKYKCIYCHADGYLRYTGVQLLQSWNTELRVNQLLKYGAISCIEKYPYVTDRSKTRNVLTQENEDDEPCRTFAYLRDAEKEWDIDYIYFWDDGEWYVSKVNDNEFQRVLLKIATLGLKGQKKRAPKKKQNKLDSLKNAYKRMI